MRCFASTPKHSTGVTRDTDSGVSMPMKRTRSSAPPMRTMIVSPSTSRTTTAAPGGPELAGRPLPQPGTMVLHSSRAHEPSKARDRAPEHEDLRGGAVGSGRPSRRGGAGGALQPLDDRAGAQPTAAAHRDEAVAAAGALQLVEGLGRPGPRPCPRAGGPGRWRRRWGWSARASKPSSFCQASTTEAKASLISTTSMSSTLRPVRSSSRWVASIGPVSISTGSTPTRQVSTIRARGRRPRASARSAVMRRTAAAPSEICDDEPAVCTPSGRATGLSSASSSSDGVAQALVPARRCAWCRVGLPSSSRSGASIGGIWVPKRSSAQALNAFVCDRRPKASVSARVMPHLSAMRSAPSNCEVISYCGK